MSVHIMDLYMEGYTFTEIAGIREMPKGTVASTVQRCKKQCDVNGKLLWNISERKVRVRVKPVREAKPKKAAKPKPFALPKARGGFDPRKLVFARAKMGVVKGPRGNACTEPPSLAMIRLAEFDPVIRRALRTRKGESTNDELAQ